MSRAAALAWRLAGAAAGTAAAAGLLAGLPWALARFTGSPLPRSRPGRQQAEQFLASPLTDDAVIRLLADAAWLLWACFALSLAVELAAVARGRPAPRLSAIAPAQALAAALVGATMISALHVPRAGARGVPPLHAALSPAVAVSAPLVPGRTAQLLAVSGTAGRAASAGSTARPRVYRVREGDDLWDIAEKFLGDAGAWPEVYQLNEGKPQPDGLALTDPNYIQAGWVLLIPQAASGHAGAHGANPARPPAGTPGTGRSASASPQPQGPGSPSPRPSQPSGPSPGPSRTAAGPGASSRAGAPSRSGHQGQVAVRLPSGALIGIAVAVMVAAALTLAAVQRRRRYRPRLGAPGSLQPDAPPLPEVITALRLAARTPEPETAGQDAGDPYSDLYEARPEPDEADGGAPAGEAVPDSTGPRIVLSAPHHPARPGRRPGVTAVGVRGDGSEAAVDIAAFGGLGLAGPGALPAARAVLAGLLAQAPAAWAGLPAVIIPAADAARLLPGTEPAAVPGLSVPATPEAALAELESLLLTLARTASGDDDLAGAGPDPGADRPPGAVLIASAGPGQARRLSAILDAGRTAGVAAVLLGTWAPGTTCQVDADGTVTGMTPLDPDLNLDGTRLFTLSAAEARDITGVLREASGNPPAAGPVPPGGPAADGRQFPDGDRAKAGRHPPVPDAVPRIAHAPGPAPAPRDAAAAGQEPAGPSAPGDRPVQLALLGPLRITAGGQEVSGGMRKARELLAFLAVHPDGASGDAIAEALWPEADPGRAAAQRNLALRKAREMLRAATGLTGPLWILNESGRYRLDPALAGTDLEEFAGALEEARNASGDARLAASRRAAGLYRGELAEGTGYEWAEPYAEAARRRALDAWTAIAEILQPADPDQALSALEAALEHDPYNEYLYVRIMRLQAAAGRPEAVRRTLALLESKLTDLGLAPSSQTRQAAASLATRPGPGPAAVGSGP